jgi:hypothetical protein
VPAIAGGLVLDAGCAALLSPVGNARDGALSRPGVEPDQTTRRCLIGQAMDTSCHWLSSRLTAYLTATLYRRDFTIPSRTAKGQQVSPPCRSFAVFMNLLPARWFLHSLRGEV